MGAGQFSRISTRVSEYLNPQYTICPYPENQGKRITAWEFRRRLHSNRNR